jgi:hypothetical protein
LSRKEKEGQMKDGRLKEPSLAWPLLLGLALLTFITTVSCGGASSEQQRAQGSAEDEQGSVENPQVETEEPQRAGADLGHPTLGEEGAPVIMTEYADYQ